MRLVDGAVLRRGSANFSTSAEHYAAQTNDLVVIHDPSMAARFEKTFDQLWSDAGPAE